MYIKVERIENWTMHSECTRKMLNLFAGTGHVNYAPQECQIVLADYFEPTH